MPVFKHCGTELDPFDIYGNKFWNCPNDCDFEKAAEKVRNEEAAKSDEERAAEN
jgi:hypothetical protein